MLAVQLESIENLRKFIDTASSAMPEIGSGSSDARNDAIVPVMQHLQRALASMKALQEQIAHDEVWSVAHVIRALGDAEDPEARGSFTQSMTEALGILESRYIELKKKAILAGRPE